MSDPTTLTPPADAPLPYGITTRGFIVSGDRTREMLAEVINDAACTYLVAAANAIPALLADHARLTAEVARLSQREPTREEMNAALGDRDELQTGDPHPLGWPTIRRCLHCRVPVAGGPTACLSCVARAENHGLSLTNEAMAERIEELTEQVEKPEDVRLRDAIDVMRGTNEQLPTLSARIEALIDERDEWIERAGRAERGWDAAIAAANEARR